PFCGARFQVFRNGNSVSLPNASAPAHGAFSAPAPPSEGSPPLGQSDPAPASPPGAEPAQAVRRAPMPSKTLQHIGPYEVHRVLGEGGFGIVYLVCDPRTNGVYALKTYRDEYLADAGSRQLFRKEAQAWIELEHHPHVVRAYVVEEIGGRLYILMEYV